MDRRHFIQHTALALMGASFGGNVFEPSPIYGHGAKRYKQDTQWLSKNKKLPTVVDAHEMVLTPKKQILLLTNDTRNNLIAFDQKGKVRFTGANSFPGAHGLTLGGEKSDTFLLITDTDQHKVFKATLQGKVISEWAAPLETGAYKNATDFVPTETAITRDGEMYVADGYGAQFITHYDKQGKIKHIFGGRGDTDAHLDNAHGITIDYRQTTPCLIVTDRNRCCFKRYALDGTYLSTIALPGANVCRPVIHGDYLYAAVLTSGNTGNANTGFVAILDKDDRLVSTIGGSTPTYRDGKCLESYQTIQLFQHPHDVLVDDDDNLYVCQWNSGHVLPYKFEPYG
jgi:peptidylamidoglycolate lyase